MSGAGWLAVLPAAVLLVAGCSDGDTLHTPPVAPRDVLLAVAGHPVRAELALDEPTRQRGLMHRTSLPDDAGMLFIFPDDTTRTFWMKNTLIPLDITFLARDGRLINVGHGEPGVEFPGVPSDGPARMVLELRAGWCTDYGFRPGDRVDVPPELLDLAR